jgi:hypothetical protein
MFRQTFTYGGGGGNEFSPRSPDKIGIRAGGMVDAIIVDGGHFGGTGGCNPTIVDLAPDDYWSEFHIRSGSMIDQLRLVSKKGRVVQGGGGGGDPESQANLRIVAIAGRSGDMVDALSFDVICNYRPSSCAEPNVDVIMDVATGGRVVKHYQDELAKTMHSYQIVSEHTSSFEMNASAEAEYGAKFSASTGYKVSDTRTETIKTKAEQSLASGTSTEQTIPQTQAAFLIGKADIMKDSDDHYWMAPTSGANWVLLERGSFGTLAGKYDLTGGARTQTGLGSEMSKSFPRLKAAA